MQEATLRLYGFSGMSDPIVTKDERKEIETVRRLVSRILRRRRSAGFLVSTLDRGHRWEITEPEDSAMVPDDAGILRLSVVNRCDYCGVLTDDDGPCCECCRGVFYHAETED